MELELIGKQAEIELKVAEQGKVAAETQLVTEKINTEKVTQEVKRLGTVYDERKLGILEAETINKIKDTTERNKIETAKLISDIKNKSNEPAKSNNLKQESKKDDSNVQGPYVERGLVSNNQEAQ